MTKLEKILGTALVGTTVGYVYSVFEAVKYIKQERQLFAELQEKAEELQQQLNDTKNSIK